MKREVLYSSGGLSWYVFGRDSEKPQEVIDTNEYLIVSNGKGVLLDPGGSEIFPQVAEAVAESIDLRDIQFMLSTHQDPDILSSLPLWMGVCPTALVYVSWVWKDFISHYGIDYVKQFVSIPDNGMKIPLNGRSQDLELIPAHYCHDAANFCLYDPNSRILFSGDIGGALLPPDYPMIVENFEKHTQYMEAFHKRWMPSNRAKNIWISRVRKLDINLMCPQHGAIFRGDDVQKFLDWFERLDVGVAV